jgi:hypothetical protein
LPSHGHLQEKTSSLGSIMDGLPGNISKWLDDASLVTFNTTRFGTFQNEAVGCTLTATQDSKMEILAESQSVRFS